MPNSAPTRFVVVAWIVLLTLVWGSTWLAIADGLDRMPPWTSAAARFVVAALAMSLIAPAIARREGGGRAPWRLKLVLGVLNFGASYAIVYWTETRLPSGVVSVLWAVFPMMMAASSSWFLAGKPLTARQWSGFALAFAGVLMLFATDLRQLGAHAIPAALVLFLSPLVSCVGTVVIKREGQGVSSALLNRDGMAIGAVLLAALAFVCERDVDVAWTFDAARSVLYLALVGTVLTFTVYFWLLRHTEAWRLSLISYGTPVVGLILGTTLRDEPFGTSTLVGSLTILAGVVLATFRR